MILWIISGGARGVGKTHLGQQLERILPDATYAKIGHHPPKKGKPANYFTTEEDFFTFLGALPKCQHSIIESNRLMFQDHHDRPAYVNGEIRIYLAAPHNAKNIRHDTARLCQLADIVVGKNENSDEWRKILARFLPDRTKIDAICQALQQQQRHLNP